MTVLYQNLNYRTCSEAQLINALKADVNTRFDKLAVATFQGSNKVILSGPQEIVIRAKRMLMQLDTDSNVNESSKVIYLNYSKAEDILKILNDISGSFSQEQNADFKTELPLMKKQTQ